jgi:hypothetical protein
MSSTELDEVTAALAALSSTGLRIVAEAVLSRIRDETPAELARLHDALLQYATRPRTRIDEHSEAFATVLKLMNDQQQRMAEIVERVLMASKSLRGSPLIEIRLNADR